MPGSVGWLGSATASRLRARTRAVTSLFQANEPGFCAGGGELDGGGLEAEPFNASSSFELREPGRRLRERN